MNNLNGFWSYVHNDDKADGKRISQLARDVVNQYEMLTGEKISLFLDVDDIEWGDNWRNKIDDNLTSVGFFVPVLTPRYFMSVECRRELNYFARKAIDLGVKDLILPLLYLDYQTLLDQEKPDELMQLVQTFQWVDWRELRFSEVHSENYRKGVANLANNIVKANRRAEKTINLIDTNTEISEEIIVPEEKDVSITVSAIDAEVQVVGMEILEKDDKSLKPMEETRDGYFINDSDDTLGTLDALTEMEEKFTLTPKTLEEMTSQIEKIGQIMNEATSDMQKPTGLKSGFAHKQMIARRTAFRLNEPTEQIWELSNKLSSQMHTLDIGIRIIIGNAKKEIQENPETEKNFCAFFNSIRRMVTSSDIALESTQNMIKSTEPLDKMSRDLRPVLRRLRQGLTVFIEINELQKEWIKLIDNLELSCEDIE
jgi:hypothetical protein